MRTRTRRPAASLATRRIPSVLLLVLALLLPPAVASAQIVFLPPGTMPAGVICTEAQVGDLDGDKVPDVVVLESVPFVTPLLVRVWLGRGDGTFDATTQEVGIAAGWARLADANGDHVPDLLVTLSGAGGFGVLVGDGTGGFGPLLSPPDGAGLGRFEVCDLDGDGVPDVLGLRGAPTPELAVLRGDGAGGFHSWQTLPYHGPPPPFTEAPELAFADLDGDGAIDLVEGAGNALYLHRGLGGGLLEADVAPLPLAVSYVGCVRLQDADGDGVPDLLWSGYDDASELASLFVAHGRGDLSFDAPLVAPMGVFPVPFEAGDLDGDGDVDAIARRSVLGAPDGVVALVNAGDGTLGPGLLLSAPAALDGFVPELVDLDGDGRLDLVSSLPSPAGVSRLLVALNRTYAPDAPLHDLGHALPGTAGWPIVLVEGSLAAGAPGTLSLLNAPSAAPVWAVAGWAAAYAPFRGGTLVPQSDLVLALGTTSALGTATWGFAVPAGASGAGLFAQLWAADAGAVGGLAASTGVHLMPP